MPWQLLVQEASSESHHAFLRNETMSVAHDACLQVCTYFGKKLLAETPRQLFADFMDLWQAAVPEVGLLHGPFFQRLM